MTSGAAAEPWSATIAARAETPAPRVEELVADLNRRLVQERWSAVGELESGPSGESRVTVHSLSPSLEATVTVPIRGSSTSVETILAQLRAAGWSPAPVPGAADRPDIVGDRWCVPE